MAGARVSGEVGGERARVRGRGVGVTLVTGGVAGCSPHPARRVMSGRWGRGFSCPRNVCYPAPGERREAPSGERPAPWRAPRAARKSGAPHPRGAGTGGAVAASHASRAHTHPQGRAHLQPRRAPRFPAPSPGVPARRLACRAPRSTADAPPGAERPSRRGRRWRGGQGGPLSGVGSQPTITRAGWSGSAPAPGTPLPAPHLPARRTLAGSEREAPQG